MPDDLAQTATIGVIASLLGFELVAAIRSWFDAAGGWRMSDPDARQRGGASRPILLSQTVAIRDHFAERQPVMILLRPRYAALRTSRYGRQLRAAIGRVRPGPFSEVPGACHSCRLARLKGHAHCPDCRQRLTVPVQPAGI
jgi:hypothetical protein